MMWLREHHIKAQLISQDSDDKSCPICADEHRWWKFAVCVKCSAIACITCVGTLQSCPTCRAEGKWSDKH
jgi:hypothetical protein